MRKAIEAPRNRRPPGPRLPAIVQTIAFKNFRHRTMPWVRRRYGDVVAMSFVPNGRVVVLMNTDHIRTVFAGDVSVFHGGEGNDIVKPIMGEHSIMLADGDEHRRTRQLLMPAFTGGAVRRYRSRVADLAAAEADDWPADIPFPTLERLRDFTLEVMLRVVLGFEPGARLDELRRLMIDFVDIGPIDILGWHSALLRRFGRWRRMVQVKERIDVILGDEISDRRARSDLDERADVLSVMIAARVDGERPLTDVELRDQLISMMLAGQETSATALAWAFYELSRDDGLQSRARQAALGGDLEVLETIVRESLRAHTVVTDVARTLTRDVEIGGYRIPAGQDVVVGIDMVHRDAHHHPSPECFRPERFSGDGVANGTWLPFGGGARRCPGAGFALMEGAVLIREVLLRHELAPASEHPEPTGARHVILVPARGAQVVARPRSRERR